MSRRCWSVSSPRFWLAVKVNGHPAPSLKRLHAVKQADGQWSVSVHKCAQEMQILIPVNNPLKMIDQIEFPKTCENVREQVDTGSELRKVGVQRV